jgi:DNA modification methylase
MPVENGEMDNELWIEWAHGIWTGIKETETLQFSRARGTDDEKHIAPLQLETVERCIKLYSNPDETVLTPFMGIGTEAYQAIRFGRKAIGIELKKEYYDVAVQNLKIAEALSTRKDLFSVSQEESGVVNE